MLHSAAARGDKKLMNLLLDYKADIDAQADKGGPTALILATGKGHLTTVKKLLEAGTRASLARVRSARPLCARHRALTRGAGADPHLKDYRGKTALMYAEAEEARIQARSPGSRKGQHAIAKAIRTHLGIKKEL